MDTRRAPSLMGSEQLCANSVSSAYRLVDPPIGSTVSWQVSQPTYITGASSGTGTVVNLTANSRARGSMQLIFTINNGTDNSIANCTQTLTLTKTIQVGVPIANFNVPTCYSPGSYVVLQSTSQSTIGASYRWEFPVCPNPNNSPQYPDPTCWNNPSGNMSSIRPYVGTGRQSGSVSLFVTNACGTGSINKPVTYCSSDPGGPGGPGTPGPGPGGPAIPSTVKGNPKAVATPSVVEDHLRLSTYPLMEGNVDEVTISDLPGRVIERRKDASLPTDLDTEGLPSGMYYITIRHEGYNTSARILVQR